MQAVETIPGNQSNAVSMLEIGRILASGRNPRRYFAPEEMTDLINSVRSKGIIQPILVRPVSDGNYELIAGERRLRAALEVGLETIPAHIRVADEIEAQELALVENTVRADMSPTEESRAASKLMTFHGGDENEVLARLGWSPAKLERRLALCNCTEKVCDALDERKISLGHAELLAAAPREKQDTVLEKIIERNIPVATVKEHLLSTARTLKNAPFSTEGCAGCASNSSIQASLFETTIGEGHCTNPDCHADKTQNFIEGLRVDLTSEYPKVEVLLPGFKSNTAQVISGGPLGLGEEQVVACKGCSNFGATLSAVPGEEGTVARDICFDIGCHQKKIAAKAKAEQVAKATSSGGKGETGKTAKPATKPSSVKTKAKASAVSERVRAYRVEVWRKAAGKAVVDQPDKALSLLFALAATNRIGKVGGGSFLKAVNKIAPEADGIAVKVNETAEKFGSASAEARERLISCIPGAAMMSLDLSDLRDAMLFLGVNLAETWRVGKDFLDLLTKSEMESVAIEIGLSAHMGDEVFGKAMKQKKGESVQALLDASGFDFAGKIPSVMAWDSGAD